jgi:histone-lysine N-methyltransferase SETMAR
VPTAGKLKGCVIELRAFLYRRVLVVRRYFSPTEMADFKEQRIFIKFCFKLKKTAAETHRMLKEAFGDNAMSQSKTCLWYKSFKDGRTSVDDDERSGRPSTSTTPEKIAKVRDSNAMFFLVVAQQSRYKFCSNASHVQIVRQNALNGPVRQSYDLTNIVNSSPTICKELKDQARDDPNFISKVITGDESWVYGYDPETKQQSSQWKSPNSPRPKKARRVRSNVKSMLIVFFLTSKALSTRNSSPLVKLSTANFTVRF